MTVPVLSPNVHLYVEMECPAAAAEFLASKVTVSPNAGCCGELSSPRKLDTVERHPKDVENELKSSSASSFCATVRMTAAIRAMLAIRPFSVNVVLSK